MNPPVSHYFSSLPRHQIRRKKTGHTTNMCIFNKSKNGINEVVALRAGSGKGGGASPLLLGGNIRGIRFGFLTYE
jgi:hypothetical protein